MPDPLGKHLHDWRLWSALTSRKEEKRKEREEEGKLGRDEGRGRNKEGKEGKEVRRHHSTHCSVKEII